MPSLATTSTELVTLNIHKFPSQAAFNAAVSNNLIGDQDISFINGDTSDVPIPNAGEVGYVLTAGASGVMYWAQGGGGGATTLSGLTDTSIVNASSGNILIYNSNNQWENSNLNHNFIEASIPSIVNNTITFNSNERDYIYYNCTSALSSAITINTLNFAENYLLIKNSSGSELTLTFNCQVNGNSATGLYPDAGATSIKVDPGKYMEFSFLGIEIGNLRYMIITYIQLKTA